MRMICSRSLVVICVLLLGCSTGLRDMRVLDWAGGGHSVLWPTTAERLQVILMDTQVPGMHWAFIFSNGKNLHSVFSIRGEEYADFVVQMLSMRRTHSL